jgi:mRNA-degrading endonuclease toxin of MazEF toxin-antitoxin module
VSRNGRDIRYTLVEYTGSKEDAERLSGQILASDGYESIDPTHPLGGPDGKKDLKCTRDSKTFIGASYFPKGQKKFTKIQKKFLEDLEGVGRNNADGFIFITNQEISSTERDKLKSLADYSIDIFHLERIIQILNEPKNFRIRLEYLDIEVTNEEMLSVFSWMETERNKQFSYIMEKLEKGYSQANDKKTGRIKSRSTKPENTTSESTFRQGDVYWADLGDEDIKDNQLSGFRPVVIVSNNIYNDYSPNLTIVPFTSQINRAKLPTHVEIKCAMGLERDSLALAEQIRTINKNKLRNHITRLDNETMEKLNKAINVQIAPYVRNKDGYIIINRKNIKE